MFDLATDEDSIELIREFYTSGKLVAAVCHGPAAFVNVTINGKHLLHDRTVTALSNEEEEYPLVMPFSLEDTLKKVGAKYTRSSEKWEGKVVVDGQVITGQNPASSRGVADAIAKAIGVF